jgi:type I restriction enzyme S subunit
MIERPEILLLDRRNFVLRTIQQPSPGELSRPVTWNLRWSGEELALRADLDRQGDMRTVDFREVRSRLNEVLASEESTRGLNQALRRRQAQSLNGKRDSIDPNRPLVTYDETDGWHYTKPALGSISFQGYWKALFQPGEEQHRIAAELDEQLGAIDEARVAAERRVAAAEALEAALLREHFHGLTPVRIGLPKEAAPAGWKWTRLVELADLESGHTPSRKHPEWWGGDIPWIALPDIRALDGKMAMETKENTNKLGIANSSARILPKDTVALSRTASVGFVTIFGRPMATSQDFVNWVCGKELSPAFLLHALRASRQHFLANASGAIHKTIYMPAVKDFHLCHPARKPQESLAAALDTRLADAATLLTAARAELAAIQALPAAALRRVFGNETGP